VFTEEPIEESGLCRISPRIIRQKDIGFGLTKSNTHTPPPDGIRGRRIALKPKNSWHPSEKENEYLRLVLSMTGDCILGNGTVDRHTYTSNLIRIATAIDKLEDE